MDRKVKLPIGIEDFEKLRTEGFYYVDKTGLITELLNNWGEVNLFSQAVWEIPEYEYAQGVFCVWLQSKDF